ncbi:MAG: hypothetical protein RR561_03150 [Peptostreptococcus sp.]|uniref:hypothetical protein n=1 Tax=Peptostreptococcus sp. TaxID=1262 RepID=UPI002FCA356B
MQRRASLSIDIIFSILLLSVITYLMSVSFSNIKQMNENVDEENDSLELLEGLAEKENRKISLNSMDSLDTEDKEENFDGYNIKIQRDLLEENFGLVKSKITILKDDSKQSIDTYSVVGGSL